MKINKLKYIIQLRLEIYKLYIVNIETVDYIHIREIKKNKNFIKFTLYYGKGRLATIESLKIRIIFNSSKIIHKTLYDYCKTNGLNNCDYDIIIKYIDNKEKYNLVFQDDINTSKCPICLCDINNFFIFGDNCGHRICKKCYNSLLIKNYYEFNKNFEPPLKCPICNQYFNGNIIKNKLIESNYFKNSIEILKLMGVNGITNFFKEQGIIGIINPTNLIEIDNKIIMFNHKIKLKN